LNLVSFVIKKKQKMNLIFYGKNFLNQNEFSEYLKNYSDVNILTASSRHEVLRHFNQTNEIMRLVFWSIAIPSDLGLIQYVKENHPETKISVFTTPIIRQSIEIIKKTDIEVMNDSLEELKKIIP